MGLNTEFHFRVPSERYWHDVGDRLAPKPDWVNILNNPGMRSLIMEGQRSDKYAGAINVNVAPSSNVQPGIFVMVNDHFQWDDRSFRSEGTAQARRVLNEEWTTSVRNGLEIATQIVSLGKQQ